jgi:hypothetical protein
MLHSSRVNFHGSFRPHSDWSMSDMLLAGSGCSANRFRRQIADCHPPPPLQRLLWRRQIEKAHDRVQSIADEQFFSGGCFKVGFKLPVTGHWRPSASGPGAFVRAANSWATTSTPQNSRSDLPKCAEIQAQIRLKWSEIIWLTI